MNPDLGATRSPVKVPIPNFMENTRALSAGLDWRAADDQQQVGDLPLKHTQRYVSHAPISQIQINVQIHTKEKKKNLSKCDSALEIPFQKVILREIKPQSSTLLQYK